MVDAKRTCKGRTKDKEPSNAKNAYFDHVLTSFTEKIQDAVRSSARVN
jgi:hypothetical protein